MSPAPPSDDVPGPVKNLLADHVTGFEELELLLLLERTPDRAWSIEAAAAEVRLSPLTIVKAIEALCAHGLAAHGEGGYRFQPASEKLRSACAQLRIAYDADRFRIVRLIGQLALDRARSSARAFASAFKIRKPTGGDPDA